MKSLKMILPIALLLLFAACQNDEDNSPAPSSPTCDFAALTESTSATYGFDTPFAEQFTQSSRWLSEDADITLVNGQGQLTANSANTTQALEAWKLFKVQMPYDKSWEIAVDVNLPLYWNTNGGNDAQVGAGIFVGKPVASGQSPKVYECNMAVVNGGGRFVQAQLIANRLGEDPIDVQHSSVDQSTEMATLKITFCTTDKMLSLFIDDAVVGQGRRIDASGLDNWNLSNTDLMDVGIMGFAENTVITSNQPTLDNFVYRIYE